MAELVAYVFAWNDWVVMPGLFIAAIVWFIKVRKAGLALLAVGLGVYIGATIVRLFYPNPLNLVHAASLVAQAIGFLVALAGFLWFWLRQRPMQSNSTPHTDARMGVSPDQLSSARAGERERYALPG